MRGMGRTVTVVLTAGLAFGSLQAAQEPQTPRFRVAVDAVRIDAVVTDKNGKVVTDLAAADFEVLQDGHKQAVSFAQFVPVSATPAGAAVPAVAVPRANSPIAGAPALPGVPVRREAIQRTIALVVDDLAMSVESLYYVKRGLHQFIDNSLQPGDLVALVRTGGSLDGLQPFTTDRRVLHAAVDNLKWNAFSRSGVEAFEAVNQFTILKPDVPTGPGGESASTGEGVGDFSSLNTIRNSMIAAGTLGSLNLVIEGARNLPGRKAILFVSEGFDLLEQGRFDMTKHPGRAREALDRAVDRATRAGVVVYSIDARGLQTGAIAAADDFNCGTRCRNDEFEQMTRDKAADRNEARHDTQQGMAYLAEQTGGFAVLNSNDLGKGLSRAAADVRDYYVLGYVPDKDTFAGRGQTPTYHKLTVKVRRPGLSVRTRKEFLGVSDVDTALEERTPAQQIVDAAISPFTATDIALRATTLPGFAPDRGLFIRALLHIDASALTFAKGEDGKATASADVLGMVFDRDGTEVAHLSTGFAAALTSDAAQDALRDGLAYTLRISIRSAGPYQVRFAVRDRASGKFGTAGEFIELPDVAHGAFALSGIVLRRDDQSAAQADADRVVISPSQAVRRYAPGTRLKYACEIYNAGAPVQLVLSVWRGNERVMSGAADTLTPPSGTARWFAAGGGFQLGAGLAPGSYVLQLAAQTSEPGKPGHALRAVQHMDFEVQ
jgi:VWFA-related protein